MTAHTEHESDPVYGWVIIGASAILLAAAVGVSTNVIAVFLKSLIAEFGWHRGSVSFIYFTGVMGLALGGPLMGRVADHSTARRMSLFGVAVIGGCLLLLANSQTLWQFYVLCFIAGFLGSAAIFAPLLANVGNWFQARVGLALGIVTATYAAGQGGIVYGVANLIEYVGWRDAATVMGLIAWIVLIPLALLIRQPPVRNMKLHSANLAETDRSSIPMSPKIVVIWLSSAVIFCCICMSVPLVHLVPLLQDQGIALDQAASVLSVVMIAAVFGRIAFGKLTDVIGPLPSYLIASGWQTALVFIFVQLQDLSLLYPFAFVFGFGYSGVMTSIIISVRTMTPISLRSTALGIVTLFAWFGHAVGGYQGGVFFDLTGNYTLTFAVAALAGAVNLMIIGSLYFTLTRRQAVPFTTS